MTNFSVDSSGSGEYFIGSTTDPNVDNSGDNSNTLLYNGPFGTVPPSIIQNSEQSNVQPTPYVYCQASNTFSDFENQGWPINLEQNLFPSWFMEILSVDSNPTVSIHDEVLNAIYLSTYLKENLISRVM